MKKATFILVGLLMLSCSSEEIGTDKEPEKILTETIKEKEPVSQAPGVVESEVVDSVVVDIDSTVIEPPIIENPDIPMGTFSYSGRIPGETSKIPTCKDKEPAFVRFDLLDDNGTMWQRESPITENDGLWTSAKDSLPIGTYTVIETVLTSDDGEPVYALPQSSEPDFHDYATTILPIDINIGEENQIVSGMAMCYTPTDIPVDGGFGPGVTTMDMQTVVFYVPESTGTEEFGGSCVSSIHFVVDGLSLTERFVHKAGTRYPTVIPADYDRLSILSYPYSGYNDIPLQQFHFTRENPYDPAIHGALVFDKCE